MCNQSCAVGRMSNMTNIGWGTAFYLDYVVALPDSIIFYITYLSFGLPWVWTTAVVDSVALNKSI